MLEKLKPCPFCGGDVKIINAEKLTINHHRSGGERGMTCKDCIYYSGCSGILNDFGMRLNPAREVCDRFKDRSRFVELPCNVGDTVYIALNGYGVLKDTVKEFRVTSRRIWIRPEKFGMDCLLENMAFLTREEAEKALKESKKDE